MSPAVLLTTKSTGPDQTRALAARLGHTLRRGDLVVLSGELGAGKTHFVKGIAEGLDIDDRITSPTFALHQRYEGRETLHHLDVYRLDDLAETIDLDLPELTESGVTVIEWGDTILDILPADRLIVRLMFDDDDLQRVVIFETTDTGAGRWRDRIVNGLKAALPC